MPRKFERAKSDKGRGFDFEYAGMVFDGNSLLFRDERRDYGDIRVIAIDGRIYEVVSTDRGEVRRIISAHRAGRQEEATSRTRP